MGGPDSYYTPIHLAEKLVSYITEKKIRTAIDFCVGNGDLLKAVEKKYANINYYGIDISKNAVEKVAKENLKWNLSACDFCDDNALSKVPFIRESFFDLIMFNPPFTCRGSIIEEVEVGEEVFKVSTAMKFILKALRYLSIKGGMYAILPVSCVYSQKDSKAWQYLQKNYNAIILEEPKKISFCGRCTPNIVLVYLGVAIKKDANKIIYAHLNCNEVISVIRGSTRMQQLVYSSSKKSIKLIHTTNIQKGKLVNIKRISSENKRTVNGFGVVIPRVCNPSQDKVAILDGKTSYILSDCVILLQTSSIQDAINLKSKILANWNIFVSIYKGTGARYTTINRIKNLMGISI